MVQMRTLPIFLLTLGETGGKLPAPSAPMDDCRRRDLSSFTERALGASGRTLSREGKPAAPGAAVPVFQPIEKEESVSRKIVKRSVCLGAVLLALCLVPGSANGQAIIKVSDNVNFRLGMLIQSWADWMQLNDATGAANGYQQNLFIRRARFFVGGQVAPNVTFFFMTDNPNLGKAVGTTAKAPGTGFIIQDAYLEWKVANEFILDAGLIFIPLCRNCIQSAATHLTMDYGTWTFQQSGATQSSVGRDTGFQAKGYLAKDHLEYRVGVFQGFRQTGSRNTLRSTARLMYNFFEVEKVPFYPGTYLGKKKVVAVGAGIDLQSDYKAYAADLFLDLPVAKGDGVTGQFDFIRWDGGATFPTTAGLNRNDAILAELGYYCSSGKVLPWLRFESQAFLDDVNSARNQKRYAGGLTWYAHGHNFNIRAGYTRIVPRADTTESTSQFTVQFQLFYY